MVLAATIGSDKMKNTKRTLLNNNGYFYPFEIKTQKLLTLQTIAKQLSNLQWGHFNSKCQRPMQVIWNQRYKTFNFCDHITKPLLT